LCFQIRTRLVRADATAHSACDTQEQKGIKTKKLEINYMPTDKIIQILLGLLTAISIALATFALKWVFNANAQIAIMQKTMELKFEDLDDSIITLADDTDDITRITKQLSKHWKLHNWSKDQIAELRHKNQMPPVSWPKLD